MADLSKLSTEDLMALKAGRISDVSTEGLMSLRGVQSPVEQPKVEEPARPQQTPAQSERSAVFRAAASIPEAALSLGSGAVSSALGGIAGLLSMPFIGPRAGGVVRSIQEAGTYQPRTQAGQSIISALSYPFEKYSEGVKFVGNKMRSESDTGGFGDSADAAATAVEVGLEALPTLLGVGRFKPAPGAPTINPRKYLADRRIEEAISTIPKQELADAARSQASAAQRNYFLMPSQALEREYPALAALEAEIRGSRAPNAIEIQRRLAEQPRQASDLSVRVGKQTAPYNDAPTAAQQVANAARMSVGEIERTPNAMTSGLYAAAESNPGIIPAANVNRIIADLQSIKRSNPGREAIATQVDDLISRISDQRLAIQSRMMQSAGRPIDLNSIPLPSNVAVNISKDFSSGFTDLLTTRPSLKGGVEAQVAKMAGMLDTEARAVSPDLMKATDVQRAMRPTFSVDKFSPLDQATRSAGSPLNFIDRVFGADKVDPAAFRSFAEQIARTDPNAIRDALGHYVAQARDKAFSISQDGKINSSAGIDFANKLIGTDNKRAAFRTALEKSAEGRQGIANPAAYADEVIREVELVRDLSKQVGTSTARGSATEIKSTDPIKAAAGQQLQSRSAITNMLISLWNKLSDDLVAQTLADPNNVRAMMSSGQYPARPPSNVVPLSLIGLQGGLQARQQ